MLCAFTRFSGTFPLMPHLITNLNGGNAIVRGSIEDSNLLILPKIGLPCEVFCYRKIFSMLSGGTDDDLLLYCVQLFDADNIPAELGAYLSIENNRDYKYSC
jgi:hypothetical protein